MRMPQLIQSLMGRNVPPLVCLLLVACGSTRAVRHMQTEPAATHALDIVYTAGGGRDCDAEQIACFRRCWNTPPPYPIERGKKGHDKYCTKKCREEYMECIKQTEASPLVFPSMESARTWLEDHETEVVVGTVVIVAGTAFVVSTAAAGALVLVPLLAL